jgi:hypothetical protein
LLAIALGRAGARIQRFKRYGGDHEQKPRFLLVIALGRAGARIQRFN